MAQDSAVFIRSQKPFGEIIGACQEILGSLEKEVKIVGFMEAARYGGFKMYFDDDSVVPLLLRRKYLIDGDESASIHPLTTRLTVRKVFPRSDDVFRKEVRENLQNLGPVLNIFMIPISDVYPDIGSGDWRVVLDVPEVSDLDVFQKFGLPDDMLIKLPSFEEYLSVKFHCIRCNQDTHTQFECDGTEPDPTTVQKEAEWSLNKPRLNPQVRMENLLTSKRAGLMSDLENDGLSPVELTKIKKEILDHETSDDEAAGPSRKQTRLSSCDDRTVVYNPDSNESVRAGYLRSASSASAHDLRHRDREKAGEFSIKDQEIATYLKGMMEVQENILSILASQEESLLAIRQEMGILPANTDDEDTCNMPDLPVTTVEELRRFNDQLADEAFFKRAKMCLKRKGGQNPTDVIKSILSGILSNDVAVQFNWKGIRGEKHPFSVLQNVFNLVFECAQHHVKDVSESEVASFIKKWLMRASDRNGGRLNRLRKLIEKETAQRQ